MKTIQLKGPFKEGQRIRIDPQYGYTYVHIGIQIPHNWPIAQWEKGYYPDREESFEEQISYGEKSSPLDTKISVNGVYYHINQTGILEFDGLAETDWTITCLTALPPEAIIDIVYKEEKV